MEALHAVFGHPVAHSLSPRIHAAFGRQAGIALRYEAIDVEPAGFAAALAAFAARGGSGANVTLPLLGPTMMFVIVTSTITAFKVFDTVAVITRGGPRGASDVLLYTSYLEGFSYFHMGSAAAMTVVFLAIMAVFAIVQARILDRKVHY